MFAPIHPRASTRDAAIVGVTGAPTPIKDRRRPSDLNVATRGVTVVGNGTDVFDMSVIVEGVREATVGEGGKTNSVWEGVAEVGTE